LEFWRSKNVPESDIEKALSIAQKIVLTKIIYQSNGHKVVGYIIEPKNITCVLPCIIANRGGCLDYGSWNHMKLLLELGNLASQGYIVIASQYSGTTGSEGKDEYGGEELNDVLVLKDVLSLHPHADIEAIGMHGVSRGGLMTYLAVAKVSWIKAAVVVGGLSNLQRNQTLRPEMKKVFTDLFGGSDKEVQKRSAVYWADTFCKKTQLLLMHGTADTKVSPLDSLDLSTVLLNNDIHHQLVLFENDDHPLTNSKDERYAMTLAWFDKHLKKINK
jgi:dipeptidyl aminopeptidase/acylaminoacyl peptidase